MIIYQRAVTLQGPTTEVMPWAMEITELVNAKTSFDTTLWQGVFGMPLGTLVWSTAVDDLGAVQTAFETLGQDNGFLSLEAAAGEWVSTPGEDRLLRIAHIAGGEAEAPAIGAYAEGTLATPAQGKLAQAHAWGVEIAELHAEITHQTVLFGSNAYGAFGQMGWLGVSPDAAGIDAAAEATATNERYGKSLDTAGPLFVEGSATRTLARRIA